MMKAISCSVVVLGICLFSGCGDSGHWMDVPLATCDVIPKFQADEIFKDDGAQRVLKRRQGVYRRRALRKRRRASQVQVMTHEYGTSNEARRTSAGSRR